MDHAAIFSAYRTDRAQRDESGFTRWPQAGHVRYTPSDARDGGFVAYSQHTPETVEAAIDGEIAYFRDLGTSFEWKVYARDEPADLKSRLLARGFAPEDEELFLVLPVSVPPGNPYHADAEVMVAAAREPEEVDEILALQTRLWGHSFGGLREQLIALLASGGVLIARAGSAGPVVGSGWIKFPPGSAFADLQGGGVDPAWRGRGVYSALLTARLRLAAERGVSWLAVDAAPMSRPILLAKGFMPISETWPMHFSFSPLRPS